ncbi:MAG: hypothetical protein IPL23_24945 [Saprospiraceae bacterium]|nr:hypothetical protein [Saprospiraceae bacterium]
MDPDPAGGPFTSLNGASSNTVTNFGTSAITVRYTVTPTSADGCVGTPFIVNVVINPNPQVDIIPNGSSNLCEGDSRIISGTVVPNATYTYLWSIITDPASMGNSTLTNPTSISPTLQVATSITLGPLTVEFTATNIATGCSATETFTFTVFDMPDITVVVPAVITACEMPAESEFGTFNLTTAVVSFTGGTPTFHISASDAQNGIGAINNPTMFFGTDQQTIWVRTASGICYDVASFMLDVLDAPLVDLTISDNTLCQNQGLADLISLPPGGVFGGTAASAVTGTFFDPSVLTPGQHTLSYTITGINGCPNTDIITVDIFAPPTVTLSASPAPICTDGGLVSLIGMPFGGAYSGTAVSGNTFNPLTSGPGTFLLTYTYTDGNGCVGSSNTSVTVIAKPLADDPAGCHCL